MSREREVADRLCREWYPFPEWKWKEQKDERKREGDTVRDIADQYTVFWLQEEHVNVAPVQHILVSFHQSPLPRRRDHYNIRFSVEAHAKKMSVRTLQSTHKRSVC